MTHSKFCRQCGQALHGRLDKKFCDDQCRSVFNNHLNSDITSTMRSINYILRKNRRILAAILPPAGKIKITKDKLREAGFDFRYSTHCSEDQRGRTYKVCYDYGYLILDINLVELIHLKEARTSGFIRSNNMNHLKHEAALNSYSVAG